jgi:hypothetical protein
MDISNPNVLDDFIRDRTRPWASEPVPLPNRVALGLWCLVVLDALVAASMYALATGHIACTNPLCSITTFNGHEATLGLVAGGCVLALLALAVFTGAFRRGGMRAVATICIVCVTSLAAASGLVLAALLVFTTVAVVGLIVVAVAMAFSAP